MAQNANLSFQSDASANRAENAPRQTALLSSESWEDFHLAGRVERALHATGYGALRNVKVAVQAGAVTLVGRVSCYYLKQIAQSATLSVPGIRQLQNDLEVN